MDHAVDRCLRYLAPHNDEQSSAAAAAAPATTDVRRLLRERIVVGDLTRPESFVSDARFLASTHVLNVAANTYFGARYDGGRTNIVGARTLFDAATRRLADRLERYVHLSTAWVCGVPSLLDDGTRQKALITETVANQSVEGALLLDEDDIDVCSDEQQQQRQQGALATARAHWQHANDYTRDKANTERHLCTEARRRGAVPLLIARPSNVVGHSALGTRVPGNLFWPFRAAAALARPSWHTTRGIDCVPVDWTVDALLALLLHSDAVHAVAGGSARAPVYHLTAGRVAFARWEGLFECTLR